jgi:Rod binding domain-containing protein
MTTPLISPHPLLGAGAPPNLSPVRTDDELRAAATEFEIQFLADMLKHAGFGKPRTEMGGGPGEEAFASLLVREQARLMTEAGGIGLAERLFEALKSGMTHGN